MLNKPLNFVFFTLVIALVAFPGESFANHTSYSRGESSYTTKINKLDDDEVEDLYIPVLFGLSLNQITSDFGDPRGGGTREHEGQDMIAILGTPIVTPTDAVVTRVGTGDSAGKYVYTANPGGENFRYMHLDDFADIKAGDELKAGDYIGTVGNTGNASGGAAHLHFEIRDREAKDPYPRITEELSLKEKMSLVVRMFEDLDDEEEMAEFLVSTYRNDFTIALNEGYKLPTEIQKVLKAEGVVSTAALMDQLEKVIDTIPAVISQDLTLGDQGTAVGLVQTYLIFKNLGPAVQALTLAGATGYYGPVTQAAMIEYQNMKKISTSGNYDALTRAKMLKN